MEIEFSWDEHKAEINLKKHGVAFEDATLVFYDAHALYKQDRFENGEYRWQAIGMVHGQAVLLVAHTVQDHNGMDHIRIISARQAEKKERKQYEQNRYLQNGFCTAFFQKLSSSSGISEKSISLSGRLSNASSLAFCSSDKTGGLFKSIL